MSAKTRPSYISRTVVKLIDVLVVEDRTDPPTRIAETSSGHGCRIRAVDGAHAARLAIMNGVPDVVVMDLDLDAGEPGWTLATALRSERRTAHVALIATTGKVEPTHRLLAPFDAYLRKPVEIEPLIDLVRQLASRAAPDAARATASGSSR